MKQTEKAHELMSCPTFDESDAGKSSISKHLKENEYKGDH